MFLQKRHHFPFHAAYILSHAFFQGLCLCLCLCIIFLSVDSSNAKTFEVSNQVNTGQVQAKVLLFSPDGLATQHQQWIGLLLKHQRGWHTYWKNPGDTGLATHLQWTTPKGITLGNIQWPIPEKIQIGDLINYGYGDEALLVVPLKIESPEAIPLSGAKIKLHAAWLVCKNECIPQDGEFELTISRDQISTSDSVAFEKVINEQPIEVSNQHSKFAIEKENFVSIQVFDLDPKLQESKFDIFPEMPTVLDAKAEKHEHAKQFWKNGIWNARIPIDLNRVDEPQSLSILLVPSPRIPGSSIQAMSVNFKVTGNWPKQTDVANTEDSVTSTSSNEQLTQKLNENYVDWTYIFISAIAAMVGGIILNLMPCVLPVLAIKAMSFVKTTAQQRHVQKFSAYLYASGVILTFLALGGFIFILKDMGIQLGWGFQLQSPMMIVVLSILFTIIALNLLGVFEIGNSLQNFGGRFSSKNEYIESFASGVLSVFVASPCTAPFMGASLGTALGLPSYLGLLIFAFLGFGFALPIIMIASFPTLTKIIPKPGQWMIKFKVFMSFPMIATVLWLSWILGNLKGIDSMTALLGLMLLLSCGIFLIENNCNWRLPNSWPFGHKVGIFIVGLSIFISGYWISTIEEAPSNLTEKLNSSTTWLPWSQDQVNKAIATGHPVFIDYSASWCITCKINENTTLRNNDVITAFQSKKVVLFKADWTHQDSDIALSLRSYGRIGVPVYVLIDASGKSHVFSEVLSSSEILAALNKL